MGATVNNGRLIEFRRGIIKEIFHQPHGQRHVLSDVHSGKRQPRIQHPEISIVLSGRIYIPRN